MSIICSVNCETAMKYKGYNLKTKFNGKNNQVYLKLLCDDTDILDGIELAKVSKNILMVEYQGTDISSVFNNITSNEVGNVFVGRITDFGLDVKESDVEYLVSNYPDGLTPIIRLPEEFKDIRHLYDLASKFPKVRFCGGQLFALEGLKTGAIGVDILDMRGVKHTCDSYYTTEDDALLNVDIDTIEIETTGKAETKSKAKTKTSKNKATDKVSKPKKSKGKPSGYFAAMAMNLNNQ